MKAQRVLFSLLSVLAFLAWGGWHYLQDVATALQGTGASTVAGDFVWVFIVVGLATAACVGGASCVRASAGSMVALAPLALILVAQGFIAWREKLAFEAYERQDAERVGRERKLDGFPRDFVLKDPKPGADGVWASFLTIDREPGTIVRIDVGDKSVSSAHPVGRIDGAHLDALDQGAEFEKRYRRFVDGEGNSLFDRYTVRHRPDQDLKVYRLERFGN